LHREAGSKNIYELHGNIRTFRCNQCDKPSGLEEFMEQKPCLFCHKSILRPNVVLFGEELPQDVWQNAQIAIRKSDLLIVIGTSLEVYPVNQLPFLAKGRTVFINNEERGAQYSFDLTILGKAREVLLALMPLLT
jgi:NAD-dependent deacetylase